MSQKLDAFCIFCTKEFKCNPTEFDRPICPNCKNRPTTQYVQSASSKLKNEFSGNFDVQFDDPLQIKAALDSVGDAFRAHGGAGLMLTEHIENGIDAVEDLVKIRKLKNYPGKIDVIVDIDSEKLIIKDNGSGMIDPVHIMKHPLKSRKSGESHQTGQYGRGLQGFRGFAKTLTYITLRTEVNQSEWKHPISKVNLEKAKTHGIDGCCLRLSLSKEDVWETIIEGKVRQTFEKLNQNSKIIQTAIQTNYEPIKIDEFKKYSNANMGTIVIFTNWLDGEFKEFVKDPNKIFERIQHHFRVPLEKEIVKINLKINDKTRDIPVRKFEAKNEQGIMEELDFYDIPDRDIINPYTQEVIGTLQVRLYQASPNYSHTYKSPFLLVGDRPLGNSIIHKMQHFEQTRVLKSPYVTGFVVANFLKPDSLRLSPKPGEELTRFYAHMDLILERELLPQVKDYEDAFRASDKSEENDKLSLQVQSFLKNQMSDIKFDLIDTGELGDMFSSSDAGDENIERISNIDGTENEGKVTKEGIKTVILYKKKKHKKKVDTTTTDEESTDDESTDEESTEDEEVQKVIRKEVTLPSEDGKSTKTVLINPNLESKDGRIRKKSFVGPGLDTYRGKFDRNMSKWDESNYKVLINEQHKIYLEYEDDRKSSKKYESKVYSLKQEHLIQESYLWHVIQKCAKDLDPDDKDRTFWEAKYKFFLHKKEEE